MSIFEQLAIKIDSIQPATSTSSTGVVTSIKDGIAYVSGLAAVEYNEICSIEIDLTHTVLAVAFNLEKDTTGLLILENAKLIQAGQKVFSTGDTLSIRADDKLLGRVINPLGQSLDGLTFISTEQTKDMPLERMAPGVMSRQPVTRPLQTGVLVVDSLVNIGKGQRELIIGDRQSGKTTLVVDAILNQKNQKVVCIYVAIGQKQSKTKALVEKLRVAGSLEYSIIVSASASDPVALQYLAPYAGVALAEYFMDKGIDVLIAYDDLTKHAWAYRQISLLLRRPPGREAYPGDVFFLHSRLLERAAQLSDELGGGSITALPIIETQAGDISAYIPTNVISITDGQIFLESELFNAGIRPAVNVGVSVTRVGGAAQAKNLKKVAGSIKLELAQYRELAAFSKFGGDLDKQTQTKLARGSVLTELLVQKPNRPYSLAQEVITIYAGGNGYLDSVPKAEIQTWLSNLLEFAARRYESFLDKLNTGAFDDEIKSSLKELMESYVEQI